MLSLTSLDLVNWLVTSTFDPKVSKSLGLSQSSSGSIGTLFSIRILCKMHIQLMKSGRVLRLGFFNFTETENSVIRNNQQHKVINGNGKYLEVNKLLSR